MGRNDQGRVPVEGASGALGNPFADLSSEGLPAGPELPPAPEAPRKRGRVVLRRETAHRGGKAVVVAGDFEHGIVTTREIEEMGTALKKHCGCGGTVKGREIELQGEQAAKAAEWLRRQGFRVAGVTS
jgi:translation initiation factor 1